MRIRLPSSWIALALMTICLSSSPTHATDQNDSSGLAELKGGLDAACATDGLVEAIGKLDTLGDMYRCLAAVNEAILVGKQLAAGDGPNEAAQTEVGFMLCQLGLTRPEIGFDLLEKVLASGNALIQAGCSSALGNQAIP